MKGMVTYRRNMPHRAPTTPPNSLVTEFLGDDTVIGDPLVVKAYQEIMSDETVNSYQVRQGKTETTANSDACLMGEIGWDPALPTGVQSLL